MTGDGDCVARQAAHGDEGPNGQLPAPGVRSVQVWVEWGLRTARRLVVIPVLMLIFSAAAAFVSGTVLLIAALGQMVRHGLPVGGRGGLYLIVEVYLAGATLVTAGAGFFQLFVSERLMGGLPRHVPRWLVFRDWADFSARMISMLALVAVGGFVSAAAGLRSGRGILFLGAAVALVIAALTVFQRFGSDR